MDDRIFRARQDATSDRIGRLDAPYSRNGGTFLGRAVNSGAMPVGQGRIYHFEPVQLEGDEVEGGEATITSDSARPIPVLVLGTRQVNVGDLFVCRSVGGRWVAYSGNQLNYCHPFVPSCNGARFSANGTVTDTINGPQPITYDFGAGAWFSPWLPYSSDKVLQSGPGSNPCSVGSGPSYYFHKLTIDPSTGKPRATLVLPGTSCTLLGGGGITPAFFKYLNTPTYAPYPALLGRPASWSSSAFSIIYQADPSECDPLTVEAVWPTTGTAGPYLPMAGATYSVPRWTEPGWGFSCGTPCPLPRKNLTVSWTNVTSGNGSGTLVWTQSTKTWEMACSGTGLRIQLSMTGNQTLGFTVRTYGSPTDCSGVAAFWSYGTNIQLASYVCEPLYLDFRPAFVVQALYTSGYRSFIVTE